MQFRYRVCFDWYAPIINHNEGRGFALDFITDVKEWMKSNNVDYIGPYNARREAKTGKFLVHYAPNDDYEWFWYVNFRLEKDAVLFKLRWC